MTDYALWISEGEQYFKEAEQSMRRVGRVMPEPGLIPIHYTTYRDHGRGSLIWIGRSYYDSLWYLRFVRHLNDAFSRFKDGDRVLYLDTDTYMIEPIWDVFAILDKYDIVSTHAPALTISPTEYPIPAAYTEFNTGVLGFRVCPEVRDVFDDWLFVYNAHRTTYGENDQAPLREVLWGRGTHVYVLPQEYNCRFGFGGRAAGKVKILHGRTDDYERLAKEINADLGIRGWRRGDYS